MSTAVVLNLKSNVKNSLWINEQANRERGSISTLVQPTFSMLRTRTSTCPGNCCWPARSRRQLARCSCWSLPFVTHTVHVETARIIRATDTTSRDQRNSVIVFWSNTTLASDTLSGQPYCRPLTRIRGSAECERVKKGECKRSLEPQDCFAYRKTKGESEREKESVWACVKERWLSCNVSRSPKMFDQPRVRIDRIKACRSEPTAASSCSCLFRVWAEHGRLYLWNNFWKQRVDHLSSIPSPSPLCFG